MPMLIALPLNDPSAAVRPYPLSDKALLIGRHADCALRLDHISVSRHHAKVHNVDHIWHVHDLNSRNGTYRNGLRFESEELREGDILHIGDWAMVFSERSVENLEAMSSWLERIKLKAGELSVQIYVANNNQPVNLPVSAMAPTTSKATAPGKVVRAKPSDILKNPAYQGTATLPTLQKAAPVSSGLKFITTPPLPANHSSR
jgi:pSer/pThr/pTyr-binding forkhead associated (FHA) protein